jgi:HK97 family phage major capsid protein
MAHDNPAGDVLVTAIGDLKSIVVDSQKAHDDNIKLLREELTSTKAASAEDKAKVAELSTKLTAEMEKIGNLHGVLDTMKKQLDQPLLSGTAVEARDAVKETVIHHMRDIFDSTHLGNAEFKEASVDLAFVPELVSAQRKLVKAKNENDHRAVVSALSDGEKKSMSMSQLDGFMFWPEISTIIRTCFLEPIGLQDLYDSFPIAKMSFLYPFIASHDLLGGFICSEDCGTVQAATNNIHFRNVRAYDWRATFCTTLATLEDSSINILTWMANEIALSARMTMNRAWISGDGVQQPTGWLSNNTFPIMATSRAGQVTAADLRAFMNSVPYEYGNLVGVMNPDTLAYFASMTDAMGRFILGDNDLFLFQTEITDSRIRLSRYLPPMLPGGSPGTWISGSFVAAAANWKKAYITPIRRNMMTQMLPQVNGPWCQAWAHWMQIGGDMVCGQAGRILQIQ